MAEERDRYGSEWRVAENIGGETIDIFVDLLQELNALDLWSANSQARELGAQERTVSGNPKIRPSDCSSAIAAVKNAFLKHEAEFIAGTSTTRKRFMSIISELESSDLRLYPTALFELRALKARMAYLRNDGVELRALMAPYADRPYVIEGGIKFIILAMEYDGIGRLLTGDLAGISELFLRRLAIINAMNLGVAGKAFKAFMPFIAVRPDGKRDMISSLATVCVRLTRREGIFGGLIPTAFIVWLIINLVVQPLIFAKFVLHSVLNMIQADTGRTTVVTRAQGGIGDIIMMTPGLHALAKRSGKKVRFAIDRKFFPILAGNDDVELVDIGGSPIDIDNNAWRNLTRCPAAAHESRTLPYVRKGRVRLFAEGMGVSWAQLQRFGGGKPRLAVGDEQKRFVTEFLRNNNFSGRPLIGVQPYSRDTYKDHPGMLGIIERLSTEYDVLIFHHVATGLPQGNHIASTAGLSLDKSLALVAALDVMVAVDSAFIHAPAAFDIPLVGIFGPTDGDLFTSHHMNKIVLDQRDRFPCVPCWRNEDLPCKLTGRLGISPCIAAINEDVILNAVLRALKNGKGTEISSRSGPA